MPRRFLKFLRKSPAQGNADGGGEPAVEVVPAIPRPAAHRPATHDGPIAHEFGAPTPPGPRKPRRRGRGRGSDGAPPAATAQRERKRPEPKAEQSEAFAGLGVDEAGLDAVAALGFSEPTPIQEGTLPLLFEGGDVVGLAQTGSGKTMAFALPLAKQIDAGADQVQALVLVPTRELADQVLEVVQHVGLFYGFTAIGLVGGRRINRDFTALEGRCQVVVGTPGRVQDHLHRGTLSLRNVRYVVLDEADEMLDIGFAQAIDSILRQCPRERQTALFSATMPMTIKKLVHRYMQRPETVAIAPEQRTVETVRQCYAEVARRDKLEALQWLYEEMGLGRSLIFLNTKMGVDRLTEQLRHAGVGARAIHGDLRQGERDRVMREFRAGELEFLVATNVAARGLDIPDIAHVINYDVPQNPEEYVHRIGRTARAGKEGTAVTFVGEWDLDAWDAIVAHVGSEQLEKLEIPVRQRK